MRPGLLCPGKVPGVIDGFPVFRRFNEAGAVMPRKALALAGDVSCFHGFNEAGAVMPRKARQPRR